MVNPLTCVNNVGNKLDVSQQLKHQLGLSIAQGSAAMLGPFFVAGIRIAGAASKAGPHFFAI